MDTDDSPNTIEVTLRHKKSVSRIVFIQTVYSLIFHYRDTHFYSVEDLYSQRDYVMLILSTLYDKPYKINTAYFHRCLDFFFNHKSAMNLYCKEVMKDKYHTHDVLTLSILYCFVTEIMLFRRSGQNKFSVVFAQYISISSIFLDKRSVPFCTLCLNMLYEKIDSIRF